MLQGSLEEVFVELEVVLVQVALLGLSEELFESVFVFDWFVYLGLSAERLRQVFVAAWYQAAPRSPPDQLEEQNLFVAE